MLESMADGDFDGTVRCRQRVIDLGCYESNYPVGIDPVSDDGSQVYPNPATDYVAVEGCESCDVTLCDALGRRVRTQRLEGSRLSLSGLAPGLYFLQTPKGVFRVVKR